MSRRWRWPARRWDHYTPNWVWHAAALGWTVISCLHHRWATRTARKERRR